jgi:hypothetical protein
MFVHCRKPDARLGLVFSRASNCVMSDPDHLRAEARALFDLAKRTDNGDESLLLVLRAIECEQAADDLEAGEVPLASISASVRSGKDREM